jgi:hypothetical protein
VYTVANIVMGAGSADFFTINIFTLAFSDFSILVFDKLPGRWSYMKNYDFSIVTITTRLLHQLMVQDHPLYQEISTYAKP